MGEQNSKKILIVEDDKFLAKMLGRMLESKKLEVLQAGTGKEGVEKAATGQPNLILLDIMLPDTDGFEVLKQVKAKSETKDIPVIIISNLGQPEDVAQGKKLGAIDHLVKSDLSLDEVVEKVEEVVA
ncbi:MAG: response regulator [Candidatus Buchananbacteria bacterium]|nr:response regulator [Candidatus Buchananbacteria bacterium]